MSAFDSDPGVRPSYRQFVAYAASWEPIPDDGLPRYDEVAPGVRQLTRRRAPGSSSAAPAQPLAGSGPAPGGSLREPREQRRDLAVALGLPAVQQPAERRMALRDQLSRFRVQSSVSVGDRAGIAGIAGAAHLETPCRDRSARRGRHGRGRAVRPRSPTAPRSTSPARGRSAPAARPRPPRGRRRRARRSARPDAFAPRGRAAR